MAYKMAWKLLTGRITFNFSESQGCNCLYLHIVDEKAWNSGKELSAKHLPNMHKAWKINPQQNKTQQRQIKTQWLRETWTQDQ